MVHNEGQVGKRKMCQGEKGKTEKQTIYVSNVPLDIEYIGIIQKMNVQCVMYKIDFKVNLWVKRRHQM